jgi:hypothetical protein
MIIEITLVIGIMHKLIIEFNSIVKILKSSYLNLSICKLVQNSSFSVPMCSSHFPESSDIKFANFRSLKLSI